MDGQQGTAQISVTVTRFVSIGHHGYSAAQVLLTDGGGCATQDGGANQPIVVLQNKTVDIVFTVAASGGDACIPIGIGLKQTAGGPPDPVGATDFPSRIVATGPDGSITLKLDDANEAENSFEFDLVIQRVADGAIGVVDPLIRNQGG